MSGIAPPPKSQNPRHRTGAYAGFQGRGARGPSHRSQSSPFGTLCLPAGRASGRQSAPSAPSERFHACTSRTAPIAPSHIHSAVCRCPSLERPWLPICVATRVSAATLATARASHTSCVSGFSQ